MRLVAQSALLILRVEIMIRYLAEAYKDYSETEYVCMARKIFDTKKQAENYLKDKCKHLQYIKEVECE